LTDRVLRGIEALSHNKDVIAVLDGGWEPEVQPSKVEVEDARAARDWARGMLEYRAAKKAPAPALLPVGTRVVTVHGRIDGVVTASERKYGFKPYTVRTHAGTTGYYHEDQIEERKDGAS
jgi:hypothetical protein